MIIEELTVRSFRAHAETAVRFGTKVNAICGPNGAGKTNLLEAIHYLCLTKSFLSSSDGYALRRGDAFFEVKGRFGFRSRPTASVRVAYLPGEGKSAFVNGAPLDRLSEIVGRFPIVVLSPEDHVLTAGGPEERRRFLDNILSQAHPVYLSDLVAYRRALKQRNALLRDLKWRPARANDLVEPWTEKLVEVGSRLVERRARFVEEFEGFLDRAYQTISDVAERPTITYQTFSRDEAKDATHVAVAFRRGLERVRDREQEQGRTLLGPHRDELRFELDDLEVRRYGSQGQHRTFALAVKVAQHFYLSQAAGEMPILLLDDVLDNLDPERRAAILDLLLSDSIGQTIITASDRRLFDYAVDFSSPHHSFIPIRSGSREQIADRQPI